jgi:hypothetical protein
MFCLMKFSSVLLLEPDALHPFTYFPTVFPFMRFAVILDLHPKLSLWLFTFHIQISSHPYRQVNYIHFHLNFS